MKSFLKSIGYAVAFSFFIFGTGSILGAGMAHGFISALKLLP